MQVIKQVIMGSGDTQTIKMVVRSNERGPQGERGEPGDAATITAGNAYSVPAGSAPSVMNTGTSSDAVFDFYIPKGDTGAQGPQGPKGDRGPQGMDGQRGPKGEPGTNGRDGAIQYVAGTGIEITSGNVIQATGAATVSWGDIQGTLSNQNDLETALNAKQNTLTAGDAITITSNTISANIVPADYFTAGDTVNGEGSSITLNNTIQARFDDVKIKGNTQQDGTPAPNPDSPQDVQVVTGEQTVKVTGKNLWGGFINDYSLTDHGVAFVNYKDGSISANGTASSDAYSMYAAAAASGGRTQQFPAGTYTLSGGTNAVRAMFIIVGPGTVYITDTTSGKVTFTLSETASGYIRAYVPSGMSANETIHPQLELNSTSTSYQPYQSQSCPINLGSIELCKIGDYQDYIYKNGDNWYVHKELAKYIFTGTEAWQATPYGTNSWRLNNVIYFSFNTNEIQIISNIFTGIKNIDRNTAGSNVIYSANDNEFDIRNTSLTSLGEVQVATNGNYVYYALATPTDTKIIDSTLIGQLTALWHANSYDGQTVLTVSATGTNLPAMLDIMAYQRSLAGTLDAITTKQNQLTAGANISIDNDVITATSTGPQVEQSTGTSTTSVMSQKATTDALATKANSSSLATVATSGSYVDLSNKPTVPTITMQTTDPGEGAPLAANNFIAVYNA
jgi:hypothetical protein